MGARTLRSEPARPLTIISLLAFALAAAAPARPAQQVSPAPEPDIAAAHVGRGYEAEKDERYQDAAKEFQEALALNPRLTRARYQLAVCWFALGKIPEAREEFERLEKETGHDPSVVYYLARLDMLAGHTEAAIQKLARLVSAPPFPDTAYYLGTAYFQKREFAKATTWLQVAARGNPHDYRVPDHLARVYQREGRKADAEKEFEISSRLRQSYDNSAKQAVACSTLLATKSGDQSRPVCQQLFDANDPDKLTTLGLIYGQHGLYAEAVRPLEVASRLDPGSSEIQHDLGLTYFRLRRYAEARVALTKAVALRPDFFGSNALLGATLYALGEHEPAFKVLSHAHALNPGDRDTANLLFEEALILAKRDESQKKYESALGYLRKAAGIQPENQEVVQWLSKLSRLVGRAPGPKPAAKGPP
jgi:tetratricopeptide (TPR) repeat protein